MSDDEKKPKGDATNTPDKDANDTNDKAGAQAKGADGAALRADLNQLWKSTVSQFDEMKDILVRSSSAGKAKIEATMLKRQQDKLFLELGAAVFEGCQAAAKEGEAFGLPTRVEADEILSQLDALQAEIEEQQEAFDRVTAAAPDAPAPAVKDAEEGPAPEVVDAKDPPPGA